MRLVSFRYEGNTVVITSRKLQHFTTSHQGQEETGMSIREESVQLRRMNCRRRLTAKGIITRHPVSTAKCTSIRSQRREAEKDSEIVRLHGKQGRL